MKFFKKLLITLCLCCSFGMLPAQASDVLVVYFSRAGNQHNGDLKIGNTAVVAQMIAKETGADIFEVKPVVDNYNLPYQQLTEYAKKEKEDNLRPAFAGQVDNLDAYKIVFIGSPVWWGDYPMIMYSFFDKHNLNGKKIVPFVTHEGSGLSAMDLRLKSIYANAQVTSGLAIKGTQVTENPEEVLQQVKNFLKEVE